MDKVIQGVSFTSIFIITFIGVGFTYTFIHELGHALAMLSVGFQISSFAVCPFKVYREDNRYKCMFDLKLSKQYFGKVQPSIVGIHTEEAYERLSPKLYWVLGGGHVLELFSLIGWLMLYNVLPEGDFRFSLKITICSMLILSFLTSADIVGMYRLCTDSISKELCVYDWVTCGPIIDDKTKALVIQKMLAKEDYVKVNAQKIDKNTVLEYNNILLALKKDF